MRRQDLATTNRRFAHRSRAGSYGPPVAFGVTVLTAFAALLAATVALPQDAVWPALSTLFFVLAVLVALLAWRLGRPSEQGSVSYWDVAGALTLFGICAGAMLDPDQMVRLVEGARRNP
jgi:hypothetical protein